VTLLIVIHAFICVFLVCVILLQPGKGDAGIGFGSSSQSIFGSAGAGNFLTKTTSVCAVLFIFTSFLLTRSRIVDYSGSVIKGDEPASSSKPSPAKPAAPAAPTTPANSGAKAPDAPKK
jgi:preprotein translocase subunit SecG